MLLTVPPTLTRGQLLAELDPIEDDIETLDGRVDTVEGTLASVIGDAETAAAAAAASSGEAEGFADDAETAAAAAEAAAAEVGANRTAFTPTIEGATTAGSPTFAFRVGAHTAQGDRVTMQVDMLGTAMTGISGALRVPLPVPVLDTTLGQQVLPLLLERVDTTGLQGVQAVIRPGEDPRAAYLVGIDNGNAPAPLTDADLAADSRIMIAGPYYKPIWTPLDLGEGLKIWLDPTLGVNTIGTGFASLGDLSGNGNHAVQATGGLQPLRTTMVAATGEKGADFNGTTQLVQIAAAAALESFFATGGVLAFIVNADTIGETAGRIVTANTAWEMICNSDGTTTCGLRFSHSWTSGVVTWATANDAITYGQTHVVTLQYSGASGSNDPVIRVDGAPIAVVEGGGGAPPTGTPATGSGINWFVGARSGGTFAFDGRALPLIGYKGALSGTDLGRLEAYLANRLQVTLA
jgi:hypothetical protein